MNKNYNKQNTNQIPKVVIEFNEDWEVNNWYNTVKKDPKYGLAGGKTKWALGDIPKDVPNIISNAVDEKSVKTTLRNKLKEKLKKPDKMALINETVNKGEKRWQSVAKDYFSLLSGMLGVPIENFEKEYFAYFNFSSKCPFFGNTFMFNKYLDFADNTMHEIMHIEFLKEYKAYCKEKGLSNNQIDHLKEILTVLLNDSMKKLLSRPDRGYTKHQELRVKALEIRKESKDFPDFLDKMIALVKKEFK